MNLMNDSKAKNSEVFAKRVLKGFANQKLHLFHP